MDVPRSAVELAKAIGLSDARDAALIIMGLIIAVGVTLWASRLIAERFTPYGEWREDEDGFYWHDYD